METRSAEPSITTPSGDSAPVRFAIHIGVPHVSGVDLAIWGSPVILLLLGTALRAVLHAELAEGDRPGICGDVHDGLFMFHTTQREAAVEKLLRFFEREEAAFRAFITIAWWCEGEQMWRLVQRGLDESRFESRLTEARHAHREAITARAIALMNHVHESLPPLPPLQ